MSIVYSVLREEFDQGRVLAQLNEDEIYPRTGNKAKELIIDNIKDLPV